MNFFRIIFSSLFIGLFLFPQSVSGQSSIPFGIKPENPRISYFEFTLNPGESVSDILVATNQNTRPIKVFIAPVDGSTASGGGINLSFDNQSGVSQWIDFGSISTVEVKRQSLEKLPFTVTVPEGTPPGEYVAGFLAQLDSNDTPDEDLNSSSGSSFSVKVIPQVGVAVIIHVPGVEDCDPVIQSLEQIIQSGKLNLRMQLINSGNTPFVGTGSLIVINEDTSSVIYETSLSYGYTIAGSTLNADIISDLPPKGEYKINIKLQDKTRLDCVATYDGPLSIGESEVSKSREQATAIVQSILQSTSVPVMNIENQTQSVEQVQQFPVWILWLAAIVFLIGLSMTLYASAILKKRK